jgi:hypothetical protein
LRKRSEQARFERGELKRSVFIAFASLFLAACSSRIEGPKRIVENGIEVVVNDTGPYLVKGEPHALSLHEEFRIDTESDALSVAGLSDIAAVDADSRGRIYVCQRAKGRDPLIFQFDNRGNFLKSFGRIGQGPGEIQSPYYLRITAKDEIPVFDRSANRLIFLDPDGRLAVTKKLLPGINLLPQMGISLLENGNILAFYISQREDQKIQMLVAGLFGADFQKIRDLLEFDASKEPEEYKNIFLEKPVIGVSKAAIYVGWGKAGNDIAVYNLDGRLKRKIRVPFTPVKVSPGSRAELLARAPQNHPVRRLKIPDLFPPFLSLFSDDLGRLYIARFETEKDSGTNLCDIISTDGVLILRAGLGYNDLSRYLLEPRSYDVVIKNDRCYCVREKPSGFKEIVVYSMSWSRNRRP